jgi:hypothetical protein
MKHVKLFVTQPRTFEMRTANSSTIRNAQMSNQITNVTEWSCNRNKNSKPCHRKTKQNNSKLTDKLLEIIKHENQLNQHFFSLLSTVCFLGFWFTHSGESKRRRKKAWLIGLKLLRLFYRLRLMMAFRHFYSALVAITGECETD